MHTLLSVTSSIATTEYLQNSEPLSLRYIALIVGFICNSKYQNIGIFNSSIFYVVISHDIDYIWKLKSLLLHFQALQYSH